MKPETVVKLCDYVTALIVGFIIGILIFGFNQ